jgi:hypothetical protein
MPRTHVHFWGHDEIHELEGVVEYYELCGAFVDRLRESLDERSSFMAPDALRAAGERLTMLQLSVLRCYDPVPE